LSNGKSRLDGPVSRHLPGLSTLPVFHALRVDAGHFPQPLQASAKIWVTKKSSHEKRGFCWVNIQPCEAVPLVAQLWIIEIKVAGKKSRLLQTQQEGHNLRVFRSPIGQLGADLPKGDTPLTQLFSLAGDDVFV